MLLQFPFVIFLVSRPTTASSSLQPRPTVVGGLDLQLQEVSTYRWSRAPLRRTATNYSRLHPPVLSLLIFLSVYNDELL